MAGLVAGTSAGDDSESEHAWDVHNRTH